VIWGVGFWTDVESAAIVLAFAAVISAVLVAFALSPAGRPIPPRRRAGGFSRAIADGAEGEGDTG